MITCEHITKSFPKGSFGKRLDILNDISFDITPGKTTLLAGPNGSGKTTLLSIIMGFYHPTTGTVKLQNKNPSLDPSSKIGVGYLPEYFSIYPQLTPLQAIKFYLGLSQKAYDPDQARDWLSKLKLDHVLNRRVSHFSKGMKQRLGILLSLIEDPSILIWDEPLSGLDPEGRHVVLELLEAQKAKGKTIILSTHILAEIENLCDHVLILNQGQIKANQKTHQDHQSIESIYLETVRQDI